MSVEKILWLSTWVFIALPIPIFLLGWPNLAIWISPFCLFPLLLMLDEISRKYVSKELELPDIEIEYPNETEKYIGSLVIIFPVFAAITIGVGHLLFLTPETPLISDIILLMQIAGTIVGLIVLVWIRLNFSKWAMKAFNILRGRETE